MIEPTDASKCDDRQVKNKADFSTKKKEGETRMISNQGMNTWKLVLFFVVSLMVVAGLCADSAIAQQQVKVAYYPTATTAKSGGVLTRVRVEYIVQQHITEGNVITIGLPVGWENAYGGTNGFGDFPISGAPKNGGFTSLPAGQSAARTSYVTVDTPYRTAVIAALTASLSGNTVTVSVLNIMLIRTLLWCREI